MTKKIGRSKKKAGKGKDIKKTILLGIAIIGLFGIFAIDEIAGRLFFAFVALIAGFLWWKRNQGAEARKKSEGNQPSQRFETHIHNAPVQQFNMEPKQTPSQSHQRNPVDRKSEFAAVNTSQLPNELPSLPMNMNGTPIAYRYQENNIATPDKYVKNFFSIRPGDPIVFKLEPDNQYDDNAIQLWSNNQMLGYVFRGKLQDMLHDFIKRCDPIYAMVFSVNPQNQKITYSVAFYRQPTPKFRGKPLATGRLTASAGEEAQENIVLCDVGDELNVDYDYEKERYEVSSDMGYVGCLPKKLQEYADVATFAVEEVEESDSGKSFLVVGAYQ